MISASVRLQSRPFSYSIFISESMAGLGPALRERFSGSSRPPKKALIITQRDPGKLYGAEISNALSKAGIRCSIAVMPDGEKYKNMNTALQLYRKCVTDGLDRSSLIAALGGGVAGDVAGFVAATYLRGIPLIQIPTTLLAMVDSSIGGKTGIDLPNAKNFVGAFCQPELVWINVRTLRTLPEREFQNGMAEVIKYGIIADTALFELLEERIGSTTSLQPPPLTELITRCVKIKADIVSKDERETKGLREILNFGHTLGHAIESATGYQDYKHGEAISIGMCAASFMSEQLGLWSSEERQRLENLIRVSGLPTCLKKVLPEKKLLKILLRDKKNIGGDIRVVLPVKIGGVIVRKVPADLILKGIKYVRA